MKKSVLLFLSLFSLSCVLVIARQMPSTTVASTSWRQVQEQAKDTVVQLFVQMAEFNWLEPYKTPEQEESWGSGFFIDKEGHLISNFHVVDQASGVKIQIPSLGKKQFDVDIVGVAPKRDLALLKLTEKAKKEIEEKLGSIPFLKLGDSDEVKRTQETLALGYPLGQQKLKSTQGIVSGRQMIESESYIQITTPINPGNSGGPSLDQKGTVIGINTAGVDRAQNVGYIIPINDVKGVIEDLHSEKLLRKPSFGCRFNYGTEQLVDFLGNPQPGGLYVHRVYQDTLSGNAGLQEGDMIYALNGSIIDLYGEANVSWSEDTISIFGLLNRLELGQKVTLDVYRKGEKKTFSFEYQQVKPVPIRKFHPEYEKIDYEIIGGMVIMQLTLNHIDLFEESFPEMVKYKEREHRYKPKLIISHIFPTSSTQQARVISAGHLLGEVNGQQVSTLDGLRSTIEKAANKKDFDGFFTFKTEEKRFLALSFDQLIDDERHLPDMFYYRTTDLMNRLQTIYDKKK